MDTMPGQIGHIFDQNLTIQRKKTKYNLTLNVHKTWCSINKMCLVSTEL